MKGFTQFLASLHYKEQLAQDSLEVLNGPEDGRMISLQLGVRTIGRLKSADIALELDQSVSRSHAQLDVGQGHFSLEDLGSTHGTYVNGMKVGGRLELKNGDEILVGSTILRLRIKDDRR